MPVEIAQLIFGLYLLLVLAVGVVAAYYTEHTPTDFYIANRSVGTAILGLTFVATVLSSFTVFGIGEMSIGWGVGTVVFLAIAAVFYTLVFATVGVTLYHVGRERDVVTPSEYIRQRYDSPSLGVVYLAVTGIFMIALIAGQIMGGGVALDAMLDIPFELAIALMAAFMIVYIHIAGYRGVIWSDTLQAVILFGALGGVVGWVMFGRGGTAVATDAAEVTEGIFTILGPVGVWTPLMIMTAALAFVFGVPAYPHMIQRYFSAVSDRTLRRSGFVFAVVAIPIYLFGALLGTWALGIIPAPENPIHVVPLMIEALMHPVVFGIVMASATAAIMSTADSVALTMSSMVSRDVYVTYVDPDAGDERQVRVTQALLVVVILVALALAYVQPAGIFGLVEFAVVGFAATSAPVFLGAYWERGTALAGHASLILGPGITILFFVEIIPFAYRFGMHYGFIGVLFAYAIFVAVSLVTPAPAEDAVRRHSRRFSWHVE